MKTLKTSAILTGYELKTVSCYGNPQYYVLFRTDDGKQISGITALNASCGYAIKGNLMKKAEIEYHITRNDTNIVDFITWL